MTQEELGDVNHIFYINIFYINIVVITIYYRYRIDTDNGRGLVVSSVRKFHSAVH